MRRSGGDDYQLQAWDHSFSARQHSYELTLKLAYYVISLELVFCGYMLLNADKLVGIHGARYLFFTCAIAALFGVFWCFCYNQTYYNNAHEISGLLHRILSYVQFASYWIYVGLSIAAFIWALVAGFEYLSAVNTSPKFDNSRAATAQTPTPAFSLPTAPEVFTLRNQCVSMAQKILEQNVVGSALTQSQSSHYNPATNRCWVELDVSTADLSSPHYQLTRYLFDGQTKELLASSAVRDGKKSGMVYGGANHKTADYSNGGFDDANDYITGMMADDRKQ